MKWIFKSTSIGDQNNSIFNTSNVYKIFFTGDPEKLRVNPEEFKWHDSRSALPVKTSRQFSNKTSNPDLIALFQDFRSGLLLKQVVELNEKHFYTMYPWRKEIYDSSAMFIDEQVYAAGNIVKDQKGHTMTPHYDNRFVIANLIINLSDNKDSTVFYKYGTEEIALIGPKEIGTGVFFFNNPFTPHNITIANSEERIVFLGSYVLKIGSQRPVVTWVNKSENV